MSITAYSFARVGDVVLVSVTSDLVGTIIYDWWVDGVYAGRTNAPTYSVQSLEAVQITARDTLTAADDPADYAPTAYPARRTLFWVRSAAADVDHYRVEEQAGAGAWVTIATVPHDAHRWSYQAVSSRLIDLTAYTWRIIPVDAAGNDGTAKVIGPELIVRTPDAPDWTYTFDDGTSRATFAAAA